MPALRGTLELFASPHYIIPCNQLIILPSPGNRCPYCSLWFYNLVARVYTCLRYTYLVNVEHGLSVGARRLCSQPGAVVERLRTPLVALGYCNQAHVARSRGFIQAHQAQELLPLLPRTYSELPRHTYREGHR